MVRRSQPVPHALRIATATLLALAGLTAVSEHAAAYLPDEPFALAIQMHREFIQATAPDVWDAYFAQADPGPDALPGADGTPDGRGAFVFYAGYQGPAAIYANRVNGTLEAHGVYGAIFTSWAAAGYENGFGYPTSDEVDAGRDEQRFGCEAGNRAQWFWSASGPQLACFVWSTGQTHWRRAVEL